MVSASRTTFKEIIPDNGVRWKPGSVYVVKHINYLLSVKSKLEEVILG